MRKSYEQRKAEIRQQAIDWQFDYFIADDAPSISWGEFAEWSAYFEKQTRKYGLLAEFRENGIC